MILLDTRVLSVLGRAELESAVMLWIDAQPVLDPWKK